MTGSKERTAFLTAVPVAAATVPLSVGLYIAWVEGLPNDISLDGVITYFLVAMIISSFAGLLVGLPVVWSLRQLGVLNFPVLSAAGLAAGALVNWIIFSTFPPFIGAIAGLSAAITWWLIAERSSELDA